MIVAEGLAQIATAMCWTGSVMPKAFTKISSPSSNGWPIQLIREIPIAQHFTNGYMPSLIKSQKNGRRKSRKTLLTTGRKGNLGEFLSARVAHASGLSGKKNGYTLALMGALTPHQDGAPTGLDITIVHLDPGGRE